MSKTLYRTYRPQKFSDVLGQDHIVTTLQNAITQNRIGHAYLFTGPRGTGKTTVARIFATAVNTMERSDFEPVSSEVTERLQSGKSMDIIEIDAASNTGVDDIRALKETVGMSPTESKYKVYIIDEVHMLSTNAFNALLKTLEEPPEHVIFILATTEIHKVPETILSRCQRFDFSRFSVENITKKLSSIAKSEDVKIDSEALELIAISAQGGMRDAESLLAQIFASTDTDITAETVSKALGTTTPEDIFNLLQSFVTANTEGAIVTINDVVSGGYNMDAFIKNVIEKLRILLLLTLNNDDTDLQKLITLPKSELDALTKISNSTTAKAVIYMLEECVTALQKTKMTTIIQLPMEVASVNICSQSSAVPEKIITSPKQPITKKEKLSKIHPESEKTQVEKTQTIHKDSMEQSKKVPVTAIPQPSLSEEDSKLFNECLILIEKENKSISNMLQQCDIEELTNSSITFTTTFSFYEEKLMDGEIRTMIEQILTENFNKKLSIKVITKSEKEKANSSELLNYASQLMGGTVTE
ncbi:MAG: DNA polymerase III subunit gamma/tau [Candidatus Moraniibacteriota bacterium]|jgi:DNA polymerase III subunit gamma/tau